jgi:hypothetical protein
LSSASVRSGRTTSTAPSAWDGSLRAMQAACHAVPSGCPFPGIMTGDQVVTWARTSSNETSRKIGRSVHRVILLGENCVPRIMSLTLGADLRKDSFTETPRARFPRKAAVLGPGRICQVQRDASDVWHLPRSGASCAPAMPPPPCSCACPGCNAVAAIP